MPKKAKKLNGDHPATQADLAAWGGQITQHITSVELKLEGRMDKLDGRMDKIDGRMDGLDGRMDSLEGRMGSLERGQKAILNILEEIKFDIKAVKQLPAEVERLKRAVFRR